MLPIEVLRSVVAVLVTYVGSKASTLRQGSTKVLPTLASFARLRCVLAIAHA